MPDKKNCGFSVSCCEEWSPEELSHGRQNGGQRFHSVREITGELTRKRQNSPIKMLKKKGISFCFISSSSAQCGKTQ